MTLCLFKNFIVSRVAIIGRLFSKYVELMKASFLYTLMISFFPTNAEERKTIIYTAPAKPLPPKEAPETGITSYDPNVEEKLLDYRDKREN